MLTAPIVVVKENERAVMFSWGQLVGIRGPGLFFVVPFFQSAFKFKVSALTNLRPLTFGIPSQQVITRDKKRTRISMVIGCRAIDPGKATIQYIETPIEVAIETLKDVAAQNNLLDIYHDRWRFTDQLQRTINEQTNPLGFQVEIKSMKLPGA